MQICVVFFAICPPRELLRQALQPKSTASFMYKLLNSPADRYQTSPCLHYLHDPEAASCATRYVKHII